MKKERILATHLARGTGRRKTSVARVYLNEGAGEITVNGKNAEEYFTVEGLFQIVKGPLDATSSLTSYDVSINVKGGGITGQADACKHGISRALASISETNHSVLRKGGFLQRDSRMVERKKYGQRGARRRFQFSKR
jgi:small subunit ribosomal protein S9